MPPINQNKIVIQTTPRARSNSTEQTTALMKLKKFSEPDPHDYEHIMIVSEFI